MQTRSVSWRVLAPEHQRANDATNATHSNDSGGAKGTLPLSNHIVGLICEGSWYITVGASNDEECSEIPHRGVYGETKDGNADNFEQRVEDQDMASDHIFV